MNARLMLAALAPIALGACAGNDSHDTSGSAATETAATRSLSVKVTGMT